jgi:multidrug efflux pump subunit AcrB
MKSYADKFSYTFLQIQNPNNSHILARLIDKSNTEKMMTNLQEYFKNTPFVRYHIMPWNPSELPIPDPPQFQLSVLGGTPNQRVQVAEQLGNLLQDNKLFPRVWQKPNPVTSDTILLQPYSDQWSNLSLRGANLTMADLADLSRVATDGRQVGRWTMDNKTYNIIMRYPTNIIKTPEDLASMPLGVLDKIIPLKALADIKLIREEPTRFRVNQQEVAELYGKLDKADERKGPTIAAQAASLVNDWLTKNPELIQGTSVQIDDAQHELNDALRQLVFAIGLSIVLVFLTMVLQLGDIVSSLLVMVAIPLGFIGVMISLFIFQSTLSLNSALGVILLNGIAVANSIILVDFLNRLVKEGRPVREAALEAARSRLRPILMTSLTTAIGMLPIAMGLGDGGKILQPLGIAISGGLWFSMSLTLVIVPALQVSYLNWKQDRKGHVASITGPQPMEPAT